MGARSRDQRKTVRYWANLAIKRLAEQAEISQIELLKIVGNIGSSLEFRRQGKVQEVVWRIVRKFTNEQLGRIIGQGIGNRIGRWAGKPSVLFAGCDSRSKTHLNVFLPSVYRSLYNLGADGKSWLRELAKQVIIAEIYDTLGEALELLKK